MTTDKLEFDFSKFITGLTICAFLLGIIYPLVYYSFFSFNAFEYVELTEIITHVIKDGVILLLPYIVGYFLGFVYSTEKQVGDEIRNRKVSHKIIRILIWSTLVCLFLYIVYQFITGKISLPFLLFYVMSFLSAYIMDMPNDLKKKLLITKGLELHFFESIFVSFIMLTIYVGTLSALLRADGVKHSHTTAGTYIIINNKDTIKSTKNYYYIGRTNKYVFYYSESNKVVDIFPDKDINKVSLK